MNFETFSAKMAELGYVAAPINPNMFFVKTKNGARVELNVSSKGSRFVVGVKPAILDAVTDYVVQNNYKLVTKRNAWSIFEFEGMDRYIELIGLVEAMPTLKGSPKGSSKEPKVKTIKVKAAPKTQTKNLSDDEIAAIKAANLQKLREVGRKFYGPGRSFTPKNTDGDGPVRTRAQAEAWIKAEEERMDREISGELDDRDYPRFLNKADALAIIGD